MKKIILTVIMISMLVAGCASTGRYNTQKGAAIGAGIGAIAGQAIGRDTESTLIGTGVGALLGTIVGNYEDQRTTDFRDRQDLSQANYHQQPQYVAPEPQTRTEPPGEWVKVPGHWQGNRWVPGYQEWRPINPTHF
ncbi:MAG: glycine zipper 2TM domain-containing protein [Deltaproteobacteria bacterium]|nr:glycine zipper 2TM domain-containing protein [Deltaproteobacteria bacterium]MBW2193503.1 glycine zipper 2TM domain-containing protein [Deltaproteobacteria bacterium]